MEYQLRGAPPESHSTIERILGFHAEYCPVARSIRDAIDITTSVVYV